MIRIPALKVTQWLESWDAFTYTPAAHQTKPEPHFYTASFPANLLRRLACVRRRKATGPRRLDTGIQRGHDESRSEGISRFVDAGYPWASLNTRDQDRFPNLRKPGWLPTSIVVNLVAEHTRRVEVTPDPRDLVKIEHLAGDNFELVLPDGAEDPSWKLKGRVPPIEIIDGQHRLLAFDPDDTRGESFELPVVIFYDLDISWQAYLFWTINITPKRISPSFGYDLFPLLRTQDWLQLEGPMTYRETRAQELTEVMWSHELSPWHLRIGMLGRERGRVTQAAWIRSLTISFVRPWDTPRRGAGGLFGAELHEEDKTRVLFWSRPQQAAYLIQLWSDIESTIKRVHEGWVQDLRSHTAPDEASGRDPAFAGAYSLLASEQGVRGVLQVANDVSFRLARDLSFEEWQGERLKDPIDLEEVTKALSELRKQKRIVDFTARLSRQIAKFDWRSQATPDLPEDVRNRQALFRAGTGYREVRRHLLRFLAGCDDPQIAHTAQGLVTDLGYDD